MSSRPLNLQAHSMIWGERQVLDVERIANLQPELSDLDVG
jgi:hypothetical protein